MYKLWRIFNALAETVSTDDDEDEEVGDGEAAVPVTVHADELELVVQRLGVILRTAVKVDTAAAAATSNFVEFLRAVETSCVPGKNASAVSSAVGELYDDIIANVLKKVKLAFHGADTDTDTDTDVFADFRARIVARMSACPATSPFSLPRAGHARRSSPICPTRAIFLARILPRMSVKDARVYTCTRVLYVYKITR